MSKSITCWKVVLLGANNCRSVKIISMKGNETPLPSRAVWLAHMREAKGHEGLRAPWGIALWLIERFDRIN